MASSTVEPDGGGKASRTLVRSRATWDGRHWAVVSLAVVTGVIHVYIGVLAEPAFAPAFYVAAVGWFVGSAVFFTSFWRRWMYALAAVYAAAQILFWVASGFQFLTIGIVDKLVEVALIGLAVVLYRDRA